MLTNFRRYAALAGIVALMLVALVLYLRVRYGKPATSHPVAVLPSDDIEQISVDPVKHTLTIKKPTGNQTLILPDHVSTIDLHKNGTVSVTSPQYGFEHRPFFGIQGSNAFRLAAGMDAGYFKKLDLGFGAADSLGGHTPIVFAQVSYNFYDNCRIGLTYGTDRLIGGSITVRL